MIMLAERASVKFLIYIRIRMHFLRRFNQIIVAQQLHRLRCGTGPIMRESQPQMTRIAQVDPRSPSNLRFRSKADGEK